MKKNIRLLAVPAIFILLVLVIQSLPSCTKTVTHTVTIQDTTVIRDTTVIKDTITPPQSILSLLTGKQWEYDSAYSNYTAPGTGNLVYVRGALGNLLNLDNDFATFTVDGFLWQDNNGSFYNSQWNFLNSDSAAYKIVSTVYGTDYGRILKLGTGNLTLYDSTNKALDIFIVAP